MSSHDRTPDPPDDRRPPPQETTFPKPLVDAMVMWLASMLPRLISSSLVPKPLPLSAKDLEEIARRNNAVFKELDSLLRAKMKHDHVKDRIGALLQQHKTLKGVDDPIAPVDLDSLPADQADLDERVRAIVAKAGTRT